MQAGYSSTPLLKKLGITPTMRLLLVNTPSEYQDWLGINFHASLVKKNEIPDLVHVFAKDVNTFLAAMKTVLPFARKNPKIIIWISWYKKAAKINTDLDEESIRQFALKNDLVDIKVCAVSDQWSGLKLVVPLAKRK